MDEASAAAEIHVHDPLPERLPHIEFLPPPATVAESQGYKPPVALSRFVASSRPWSEQPVALSRRTTVALWILTGTGAGVCAILIAVLRKPNMCRGLACSIATFGGRPWFTLVLAAAGTACLLTMAAFTHGLTRVGARDLCVVIPAAGLVLASVAGAVVVLVGTVLIVLTAVFALVLLFALLADGV